MENSHNLRKHSNMNVRTKQYLRIDAYVVTIWNGTYIGLNSCNFGQKKNILVPSNIANGERVFSKQNAIKSRLRNRLKLKTLDALMRVSLCGLEVDAMDWATIFNIWINMLDRWYLR